MLQLCLVAHRVNPRRERWWDCSVLGRTRRRGLVRGDSRMPTLSQSRRLSIGVKRALHVNFHDAGVVHPAQLQIALALVQLLPQLLDGFSVNAVAGLIL